MTLYSPFGEVQGTNETKCNLMAEFRFDMQIRGTDRETAYFTKPGEKSLAMCSELHYYNLTIREWIVPTPLIHIGHSKRCFSMQETGKIYGIISLLLLLNP